MKVQILGGGRSVSGFGQVTAGDVVEMPEDIAQGLCAQGLAVAVREVKPFLAASVKVAGQAEEKE